MHRSIDPCPRRRRGATRSATVAGGTTFSTDSGVRPRRQRAGITVLGTADDGASLVDLRRHIDEVALPRLVGALELPALDTDVLLRLTTR
jgi:hypothetical protein